MSLPLWHYQPAALYVLAIPHMTDMTVNFLFVAWRASYFSMSQCHYRDKSLLLLPSHWTWMRFLYHKFFVGGNSLDIYIILSCKYCLTNTFILHSRVPVFIFEDGRNSVESTSSGMINLLEVCNSGETLLVEDQYETPFVVWKESHELELGYWQCKCLNEVFKLLKDKRSKERIWEKIIILVLQEKI